MNVILVITGNQALGETLRAALPETDLLLFEATVDAAGRRLVSLQADLIMLDDGPGLGGQALAQIKAIAPATPVIVFSCRGDLITQAGLTRAGADAVLVKPFSCDALRDMVADLSTREKRVTTPAGAECTLPAMDHRMLNQHQMALRWLGRAAMYCDDPIRLSESLVESAADIFDAARCAVLMEQDGAVKVTASWGLSGSIADALRLSYDSGLMRYFDEHACLLDRAVAREHADALKELQVLHGRLAAPLLRNGRVFGAIVLGEKASAAQYSNEERELLTLVARSTSAAFERAALRAVDTGIRHELNDAFAHFNAGIVTVFPDRRIGMMNPAAERLLDLRAADLIGKSVQKLGSAFADVVLRVIEEGAPRHRQIIRDPAVNKHFELHAAPMRGGGAVAHFMEAEEARAVSADIADSPFWEYLSSRVAQEIKNPMVAINTFAQLLPRKYDSMEFREAFSTVVQKEIDRINRVAETLFEFSRNPKFSLQRCNVNDTVRNILKSFEDELAAKSIALETKWGGDQAEAEIDPEYFSEAVRNVLRNSIDALPAGGRITVSTTKENGHTEIRVSDSGAGVSEKDAPLVFQPFYSSRERGMGLGLPLARRILQGHHGELKLAANADGGSYFSLRLPSKERGEASKSKGAEHADDTGD